jgi:hypothetical protein
LWISRPWTKLLNLVRALDGLSQQRIIKDAMVCNSEGGGEPQKRRRQPGKRPKAGRQRRHPPGDTLIEETAPAELFDPEVFGIWRRDVQLFRRGVAALSRSHGVGWGVRVSCACRPPSHAPAGAPNGASSNSSRRTSGIRTLGRRTPKPLVNFSVVREAPRRFPRKDPTSYYRLYRAASGDTADSEAALGRNPDALRLARDGARSCP